MNKRFLLALVLTAIVIVATPLLFPGATRQAASGVTRKDSVVAAATPTAGSPAVVQAAGVSPTAAAPTTPAPGAPAAAGTTVTSTEVRRPRATYTFTSRGATATAVVLDSFASRRLDAGARQVSLLGAGSVLSRYTLAAGGDTIALDTVAFQLEPRADAMAPVTYRASVQQHEIQVTYVFAAPPADDYLINVTVTASNAPVGSSLLAELPNALYANERDTLDDINHLAMSYHPSKHDVKSLAFSKLDPAEVQSEVGPIDWLGVRDKYFLVAYRAGQAPFAQVRLVGGQRTSKVATSAVGAALIPVVSGTASFSIYAGPQDFVRLQRLGSDLDQVNPYGSFLRVVVQPFATLVMRALLWMKHTTNLNYGWVLVLFGISIRLLLWPLNQSAMRTSLKMQRLQPELQALQSKYADDPKKQQEAVMKVYASHGMSPFSPLMGCLPLLLPMPVLFALYHVFGNTIEFRGVSFLWLPDISARDPYFITPLLMGASMFLMSWISLKNSPPNPQAKMMSYMMPVVMTVIFLNFASGLNLYYAVQNIAAIPQQWLLARERMAAAGTTPAVTTGKPRVERTT